MKYVVTSAWNTDDASNIASNFCGVFETLEEAEQYVYGEIRRLRVSLDEALGDDPEYGVRSYCMRHEKIMKCHGITKHWYIDAI